MQHLFSNNFSLKYYTKIKNSNILVCLIVFQSITTIGW